MFQTGADFKSYSRPLALGLLSMVSLRHPRPAAAQKLGLSSSFGDVTLENLEPGKAYPLRALKGHGYSITNLSEVPVDLLIEAAPPLKGSLKPGYEPIPDTSWVKVSPARVRLAPGQTAEGEVTITVPDDPGWKDRHFQCALYTHTLQGSFVNVGIYDKLFFSTGPGPRAAAPRLEWLPRSLTLRRTRAGIVPAGAGPEHLELYNESASSAAVRLAAVDAPRGEVPAGYSAGDARDLRFDHDALVLQAGQIAEVPFEVKAASGAARAFRVSAESQTPAMKASAWVLVQGEGGAQDKTKR